MKKSVVLILACIFIIPFVARSQNEEVKAYMRDNDLKMNTCDQLKQVVTFYNSLIPTFDP